MSALERIFDVGMMVLFAILGAILSVIGWRLGSGYGIAGGVLVILAVVPLWLGGRGRRDLRWYPAALVVLALGLLLWVHPWTG